LAETSIPLRLLVKPIREQKIPPPPIRQKTFRLKSTLRASRRRSEHTRKFLETKKVPAAVMRSTVIAMRKRRSRRALRRAPW
jgi:hypothetical protein